MVFDQTSKYLAAKKSQTIAFPAHFAKKAVKKVLLRSKKVKPSRILIISKQPDPVW